LDSANGFILIGVFFTPTFFFATFAAILNKSKSRSRFARATLNVPAFTPIPRL
jgi:hypothetical protein